MSLVRVHNFAISLDGFGTGDGLTLEAPFGHAGMRLHEWYLTTRFFRAMRGEAGGSAGVDNAFAQTPSQAAQAAFAARERPQPKASAFGPTLTSHRLPYM